jgi:hypothetical protein
MVDTWGFSRYKFPYYYATSSVSVLSWSSLAQHTTRKVHGLHQFGKEEKKVSCSPV